MAKVHNEIQDITDSEWTEIKELYDMAVVRLNNCKDEDDIMSICNHVNGYNFITDTFNEDVFTISIATDNTEPNTLQGIRVYIDKTYKPLKVSKYADIFFNDDEYPFEDINT